MLLAQQLVECAGRSERYLAAAKAHAELLIRHLYNFVEWNVSIEWE